MKTLFRFLPALALAVCLPSFAINAQYARQLERSGCTQMTELQGCDIRKTKAENAKAGFASESGSTASALAPIGANTSPYTGHWIAKNADGRTVAMIEIDAKDKVRVNNKTVKAKRTDGGLMFKDKSITYFIQGDRRLQGEDIWNDWDAKTSGTIAKE